MLSDRFSLPLPEFISYCSSFLQRLQCEAPNSNISYLDDLTELRSLLATVNSPAYLTQTPQLIHFVREFLPGSLSALFAHPVNGQIEFESTSAALQDYWNFILFHLKSSIPSNSASFPLESDLPGYFVSPPPPPAFPSSPVLPIGIENEKLPTSPPTLASSSATSTGGMVENPLHSAFTSPVPVVAEIQFPEDSSNSTPIPAISIPSQASAAYLMSEPFPQEQVPSINFLEYYRSLPPSEFFFIHSSSWFERFRFNCI